MMQSAKVTGQHMLEERASACQMFEQNNSHFQRRRQISKTKDFSTVADLGIFQLKNDPTPNIFYFYASKYSSKINQNLEDYIISQVQQYYDHNQDSFALVYMYSNFIDFLAFKKILQKWPRHFVSKLRKVYIIGISFMIKLISFFSFGTYSRICDDLFVNLDNKQQLYMYDSALMRQIGENPQQIRFSRVYKDSIKIVKKGIYGKTINQYDLHPSKYPTILLRLIKRMLIKQQDLKLQGIFRKNCDVQELQKLQIRINSKQQAAIQNQQDILVVCGCFKKLLNNLQLPLFSYDIYNRVISFGGHQYSQFIKKILEDMQKINFKVFVLIIVFLTDYIISLKEHNKMNAYNIAVVFGPCFFRPLQYDIKDLLYSNKFSKFLELCLSQRDQIFPSTQIAFAKSTLQQLKIGSMQL